MTTLPKPSIAQTEIIETISEFNLDTLATQEVAFKNNFNARLFKVDSSKIKNPLYKNQKYPEEIYIIYLKEIAEIASFSHLVGEELDKRCLKVGEVVALAIQRLWPIDLSKTLVYDVLRAGPGYRVNEGLEKSGIYLPKIRIRPRYKLPSYRHHNGTSGQLEVIYENFENLKNNQEFIIIKPDTEATGGTSRMAIEKLMENAKKKNVKIKEIIFTGFISVPSLGLLQSLEEKYSFKIKILAWGNLTALYKNGYDMPLYGIDEAYFRETGEIRKIGGVIPQEILQDYLTIFPPGADQPGDWSARQSFVDTGLGMEKGDILKHLQNSLKFIQNLYEISKNQSWFKQWHKEIFENEIDNLKNEINNQKPRR
ncbi:MAG: hypothetical protein ACP5OX_00020 [Minisyncoccia bacterium]